MPTNWRNRCKCPCGCDRRCRKPYVQCSYCAAEAHSLSRAEGPVVRLVGNAVDRLRRFCSACGTPGEWFTFKPGDGRCDACST